MVIVHSYVGLPEDTLRVHYSIIFCIMVYMSCMIKQWSSIINIHLCIQTLYDIFYDVYFIYDPNLLSGHYIYIYYYLEILFVCMHMIYQPPNCTILRSNQQMLGMIIVAYCSTNWNTGIKGFSDLHVSAKIEGAGSLGPNSWLVPTWMHGLQFRAIRRGVSEKIALAHHHARTDVMARWMNFRGILGTK